MTQQKVKIGSIIRINKESGWHLWGWDPMIFLDDYEHPYHGITLYNIYTAEIIQFQLRPLTVQELVDKGEIEVWV